MSHVITIELAETLLERFGLRERPPLLLRLLIERFGFSEEIVSRLPEDGEGDSLG